MLAARGCIGINHNHIKIIKKDLTALTLAKIGQTDGQT